MKLKLRNPKEFLTKLKNAGQAFQLISTTLTKTIITETNVYYYTNASGLKPHELGLIRQVKNYVVTKSITCKADRKRIKYIDKHHNLKSGIYRQGYEIDLTKAYWNFAFKNGFLSKEIYDKGNDEKKYSKKARLIALGNWAKVKLIFDFDGSEYGEPYKDENITENLFFKVSQQTDDIMQKLKLIAGDSYLFYWVDAIFVKDEQTKNLIVDYLKSFNFEHKVIEIDKIDVSKSNIIVTDDQHVYKSDFIKKDRSKIKKGDLKPRPFVFEPLKGLDLAKILNLIVPKIKNRIFESQQI